MAKTVLFSGLALIIIGGALVPLPGPGYPVLVAGLATTFVAGILLWYGRASGRNSAK